ncbi:hypothetical protein [Phenylobacterium sp.]|uniref:hypothetical protein n=1 Tax=Phenylobacterium sp. TaxID=1871053 RepID=UPI0039342223
MIDQFSNGGLRRLLTIGAAALAIAVPALAREPSRPQGRPVGLCVLISGADLRVSKAVIIASSGDRTRDEQVKSDVIGMRSPVPVAWTDDFWSRLWIGSQPKEAAGVDCDALNRDLCGAADCRMAR